MAIFNSKGLVYQVLLGWRHDPGEPRAEPPRCWGPFGPTGGDGASWRPWFLLGVCIYNFIYIYIFIYLFIHMYLHIYIFYIDIQRERERNTYIYIYYTYIYIYYTYIIHIWDHTIWVFVFVAGDGIRGLCSWYCPDCWSCRCGLRTIKEPGL